MPTVDDDPQKNESQVSQKTKRSFSLSTVLSVVAIVGVASFILGTRSDTLIAMWQNSPNASTAEQLDFSGVQDVYSKLRKEFDGKIDEQALIDGAKKGLVEATGDPYTAYFTDKEAEEFLGDLEGKFSGIGAELGDKNKNLVVIATLDDSPARKAGLLPKDIIAKVNDQETTNWSVDKAVSQIRGEKGTTVKLTILRGQDLKEFSIVRAEITNPSVRSEVTKNNIGILRISRFDQSETTLLAQRAAESFVQKKVKGVVLDLRGNGGGYLTTAQELASLWLKQGDVIVQERHGERVGETLRASGNALLKDVPTVVLIDGGSASASEILAGALRDHNAAKLVGEKSFGKGSVQQIVDLPGGGKLKVTIAKWYTPNGKNIDKEGISPDTAVKLSDIDTAKDRDPQKDKALELLAK